MDDIDSRMLMMLQQNARVTISEISNQIHLSVPAVSDRLKRLESSGVISKYTVILNPKQFNKELTAIMFISLEKPRFSEKFLEFVKTENEILECFYIAGDYDFILKIITGSTSTLESLLNKIKSIPGVQKTKTIVTLSTIKNNYSITPTDY